MLRRNIAVTLALLAPQAVWADLTVRYKLDVQFGAAIPAAAADTVRQQLMGSLPSEMLMLAKGDKCVSAFGSISSIIDAGKGEITLLNPGSKQFATVAASSYADKVAAVQPFPAAAQQILQNLKMDVQTSKTGQTAVISGIEAEETLVTMAMEIPGSPIGFRIELHEWLPVAGELNRIPALTEMAGCSSIPGASADPSAMIEKMLGQLPGGAAKLADAMKALVNDKRAPALKIQIGVYAPALAAMMQAQGVTTPAADSNAPVVEVQMNLTELSLNPLPDTVFQVPEGYQEAPLADLLILKILPGTRMAAAQGPSVQITPAAPAVAADYTGPAVRVGGGVTAPTLSSRIEPKYTDDARHAHIEGSVTLSLVVDPEGVPRNLKVVRSLDPGLDQKAMEAVSAWRFKPGQKDGNPVAIQAQVEVTFRLLDKPPDLTK